LSTTPYLTARPAPPDLTSAAAAAPSFAPNRNR